MFGLMQREFASCASQRGACMASLGHKWSVMIFAPVRERRAEKGERVELVAP